MAPVNRQKAQDSKAAAADIWDEAQLEAALKRLDKLHVQARLLRTTIPRMTQPLTTSTTPSELYRLLMKSVAEAHKEIQDFKELMSDAESKKVLERAKKSHKDNPRGLSPGTL
ncbi:unnamed protein product [Parascedosporium putredinis]|uniref:Uncharacterized protein n=1 Tax=Parascedosporium putredinis TaxID=1442378 RepID=A0A9P1HAK6_9PEZI|nr:unnamed protein product [Parascedosporium putredinis]CAI8002977.1 unnamed protein product [Parascedosporium putredinis]